MKRVLITTLSLLSLFSLVFITLAQPAHGQIRPRVSDNQVRTLLTRIETGTDTFRNRLNNALDASSINGSRSEDQITEYVTEFEQSTDQLRQRFDSRNLNTTDVQEVLSRASYIDAFMRDYRLTTAAQTQWNTLRTDLNTLANYYRVSWNWTNPTYPGNNNTTGNNNSGNWGTNSGWGSALTGTYRLNAAASDDVEAAVGRANGNTGNTIGNNNGGYNNNNRGGGRGQNGLIRRLTPPENLVIEKNNRQVTIASDMAPQVVVTADGVARTEASQNGRTISMTASLQGNGLNINYEGDRMNDFFVSFMPARNGQLRVVRRVYLENSNQTVTVASVYDKTSQTANWSSVNNGNYNTGQNTNNTNYDNFIIPDGTRIVGTLENALYTKTAASGDRFTMRVISPSQYSGAIISGAVSSERSGRVSGRANMSLNFEEIRLRNGKTYKFAGTADEVRLPNGEKINVTNEGTVRDSNQGTKTAVRSGIGAAIGAIIGAVAGGGSGAAIGAAVGAGAGAGSVIIQGRDDLKLETGTEFVITSSAPRNVGQLR